MVASRYGHMRMRAGLWSARLHLLMYYKLIGRTDRKLLHGTWLLLCPVLDDLGYHLKVRLTWYTLLR